MSACSPASGIIAADPSVLAAQEKIYRACLATGRTDCPLQFDLSMIVTPQLLAALATLAVIALIPVLVKRLRAKKAGSAKVLRIVTD